MNVLANEHFVKNVLCLPWILISIARVYWSPTQATWEERKRPGYEVRKCILTIFISIVSRAQNSKGSVMSMDDFSLSWKRKRRVEGEGGRVEGRREKGREKGGRREEGEKKEWRTE